MEAQRESGGHSNSPQRGAPVIPFPGEILILVPVLCYEGSELVGRFLHISGHAVPWASSCWDGGAKAAATGSNVSACGRLDGTVQTGAGLRAATVNVAASNQATWHLTR